MVIYYDKNRIGTKTSPCSRPTNIRSIQTPGIHKGTILSPLELARVRASVAIREKGQQGSTSPARDAIFDLLIRACERVDEGKEMEPGLDQVLCLLQDVWDRDWKAAQARHQERVRQYCEEKLRASGINSSF